MTNNNKEKLKKTVYYLLVSLLIIGPGILFYLKGIKVPKYIYWDESAKCYANPTRVKELDHSKITFKNLSKSIKHHENNSKKYLFNDRKIDDWFFKNFLEKPIYISIEGDNKSVTVQNDVFRYYNYDQVDCSLILNK